MNTKITLSKWIAMQKALPVLLEGKIVDETEKAIKVEYITTATVWLPKSQITIETMKKQGEE